MSDSRSGSLLSNLTKGALAGAVGVWALDRVTWLMWRQEDPEALAQEKEARPEGLDPAHDVVNRVSGALGSRYRPKQPNAPGLAVHYSLGVVPGALYAAFRRRSPDVKPGYGMLLGLGLFLVQDELLNPILGTSGNPTEYPWQAHARGLVGHAVYGAATDVALEVLDRVTS